MTSKAKTLAAAAICVALLATLILSPHRPRGAVRLRRTAGRRLASGNLPARHQPRTPRDTQSIVAKFTEPNGITRDVTAQCKFDLANPSPR